MILWLAQFDAEGRHRAPLIEYRASPEDILIDRRAEVEKYLHDLWFHACGNCFQPVVEWPGANIVTFPQMTAHRCGDNSDPCYACGRPLGDRSWKPGRRETVPPSVRVTAPKVLQE